MTDSEPQQNLSKSDETIKSKPKNQPKIEDQLNNEDKINAIYDMLPMIIEAYSICQFMLENR
jgi:hypothetical protein